MTTTITSDQHWTEIHSTDNREVAGPAAPSNCTPAYAAEYRATVEEIEAAFTGVLADIEGMTDTYPAGIAEIATRRQTASTCYVEALVAYRAGDVDSAAVALHCARYWATGRV